MILEEEGHYELSWNDANDKSFYDNFANDYTLFWCQMNWNHPGECDVC